MRAPTLTVAAAALLALGVLVALAVVTSPAPSRAEQAERLAAELRCPDCQALSVADAPTESAAEIRRQIDALLAEGRSPEEVRQYFVERYGEWILLAPTAPLAWVLPLAALLAGVAALVARLRHDGGRAATPPAPTTSDADLRRVREEAEALDA